MTDVNPSTSTPDNPETEDHCFVRDPRETWAYYDSPISCYDETFHGLLDRGGITALVAGLARELERPPVVVDLMSSSAALRSMARNLRRQNFAMSGVSVSLVDDRTRKIITHDEHLGITHIKGDLAEIRTYKQLIATLSGRKADVVLERGWGGHTELPYSTQFFEVATNAIWRVMDRDHGVLLAQLPGTDELRPLNFYGPVVVAHSLARANGMRVQYERDSRSGQGVIRLEKRQTSPARLKTSPVIDE